MAGKYRAPGKASPVQRGKPTGRRAAPTPTFGGTPLDVQGLAREALGSTSLLGSSIPKGLLAATFGAHHAGDSNALVVNQSISQQDIANVLSSLTALSTARRLRADARAAEAEPPTASPLTVESVRMQAHFRGPRVVVMGMIGGDIANVVSMFARYGYTVNRTFTPERLDPMTKFSYWQTDGAVILGAVPQQRRQTIAAAFDRGTTVWTNVADIGTDVSDSNDPRPGIGY